MTESSEMNEGGPPARCARSASPLVLPHADPGETPGSASPQPPRARLSRRSLLGLLGAVAGVHVAGLGWVALRSLGGRGREIPGGDAQGRLDAGPAEALKPASGRILRQGSRTVLLLRRPGGDAHAYLASCTHLGCTVAYEGDRDRILCGCHGGVFDAASGKNLEGPPPVPLSRLNLVEEGGRLWVQG